MNRKQRRAAQSNLKEAVKRHRRAVALRPNDAQAHNELACVLLQQGQLEEAAAQFARAMTLMPELFEQYTSLVATLINVNPTIRAGMARVASTWPRELPADEILRPGGLAAVSRDPMLRCMLESATVRDLTLERYLTSVRRIMLEIASRSAVSGERVDEDTLGLCCSLAKQCFINAYVFASNSDETEKASRLRDKLLEALASGQAIAPLLPAATAAYFPLFRLPGSQSLPG